MKNHAPYNFVPLVLFYWKAGLRWFSYSAPSPSPPALMVQMRVLFHAYFYVGMEHPDPGPHVCPASSFPSEPSLGPSVSLGFCGNCLNNTALIIPEFLSLEVGYFHEQSQMCQCLWGQHNRKKLEGLCRVLMKAQRVLRTLSSETWPPLRGLPGEFGEKGRNATR